MKAFFFASMMLGLVITGFAQNPVTIGSPDDDTLFVNSGQNFLLIPGVDDQDPGVDQDITFTVHSSNTEILEVSDVVYEAGSTFALVHVLEKGNPGTVTLDVEATDEDGTALSSFDVYVGPYNNPGINFEIHDMVFWQRGVPLDANPAYSMIADSGRAPYEQIDLASLQLSVYSDCQNSPPCTGTDFFTALLKGYLVPPTSGNYYLYMAAGDQCEIGLSVDEDYDKAEVILFSPSEGRVGSSSGSMEWKSVQVYLEAGRTYALYGAQWNIHTFEGGIMWEGPGINKDYIPGKNLSYVYDVVKPGKVNELVLEGTGINDLRLSWSPSSDDRKLAGYNVYVNGILSNEEMIEASTYRVSGLSPETNYCVMLTAVDRAGNESAESSVICTTTYGADVQPPSPPDEIEATVISDVAVKMKWSGATDNETEIRGYNLYVDGILYNQTDPVYIEESYIYGLEPESTYEMTVEAIDAAYNVSEKSEPLMVSTTAFDPYDVSITDKKARLNIRKEAIGRSEGLGINPPYESGEFLDDPSQLELLRELEPAAIRWGGLNANPMNFRDHVGAGKAITFGRFMSFCNEIGAYTVIVCGVEDGTDWMKEPETFTDFLEYIAGSPETEFGALRAQEGYSESLLAGSRGLIFEFGNEVWGAEAHEAQIGSNYSEYGEWAREMARLMKASGNFDSTKIFLNYSGRRPVLSDSYGLHESMLEGDQGEVDWMAVSGYLGGNLQYAPDIDPGDSEGDYYKNGIAEMARNLDGLDQTMITIVSKTGELKPYYMYEANMTDNSYFGRLGQAIIQTDYYASSMKRGSAIPSVFHLTGGQWKMVIPSQDYKKTPLFHTTRYFNAFCKGNVLSTGLETLSTIENSNGEDLAFDPVGGHAFVDDGMLSILLFSRDFGHDYKVQLNLPEEIQLSSPETARQYVISGDHFSDRDATIDSSMITLSDGMIIEVPAFSMVVITVGREDQGMDPLPLGYYDYVKASSISIFPYASDDYIISDRRSKILRAKADPDSAFYDGVVWKVDTHGVECDYGLKSYGFEIEGSGTCGGNGTITVTASSWDNALITDQVTVEITNQGTDCGTGKDEFMAGQVDIYPNPASKAISVEGLPHGPIRISISDISGRVYMNRVYSGPVLDLDVSSLHTGIYYLGLSIDDKEQVLKFIKE